MHARRSYSFYFVAAAILTLLTLFVSGCSSPEEKARKAQERIELSMKRGQEYINKQDYSRAVIEYRRVLQMQPRNAEAWYQLGLTYAALHDTSQAIKAIKTAADIDPKHVGAQALLAELMTSGSNAEVLKQGQERAAAVLAVDPSNDSAVKSLALSDMKSGNQAKAVERLSEHLEKYPAHIKSAVTLASIRLSDKKPDEAEKILLRMVEASPKESEAHLALARFYRIINQREKSEEQLRIALSLKPQDSQLLSQIAGEYVSAGKPDLAEKAYRDLSKMADPNFKTAYGEYLLRQGKKNEAVAELQRVSESDPGNRQYRTTLISAYLASGNQAKAQGLLEQALAKNENDTDALMQRAQLRLQAKQFADARKDLQKVLSFRGQDAQVRLLMAFADLGLGDKVGRIEDLGEAVRIDPKLLAARLELALAKLETGDKRTAMQLIEDATPEQKLQLLYQLTRNEILMASGDWAEARKSIASLKPYGAQVAVQLQEAAILIHDGSYARAREIVRNVFKSDPNNMSALHLLGKSFAEEKNAPGMMQAMRELAQQYPQSAMMRAQHAQSAWGMGYLDEARTEYEFLLKQQPGNPVIVNALAQIDIAQQNFDNARKRLAPLLNTREGSVPARYTLAMLEQRSGNTTAAVEQYRQIIAADPKQAIALNNLAYQLLQSGKNTDEALRFAQQALEVAPNSPIVQDTAALAHLQSGHIPTAVRMLEPIASRPDANPEWKYHLGIAYAKNGDTAKSMNILASALRSNPNPDLAMRIKEAMDGSPANASALKR